jgi:outer membrane protein TolC
MASAFFWLIMTLVLLLGCPGPSLPALAATPATASSHPPLSLAELEELAVQRDPGVRAADYRIEALQYRYGEAQATHWPEFRTGYQYNSNPVFGEVQQGYANVQHHAEAGVTFNILKRLALAPGEQAKINLEIKAAKQERLRAVQGARWRVRQLYLDFQDSRLEEQDYQAMVPLLAEALKLAQLGQRQQEILTLDTMKLKKQLQEIRQRVHLAKAAQSDRRTLLAGYLGLEPAHLQLAPYSLQNRRVPPFAELVKKMRQTNPTLAAIKFRAQEAKTDASYAPYNYLNFHLDAFYNMDHYRTLGNRTGALLGVRFHAPLAVFSLTKNRRQRSLSEAEALNSRGQAMAESIEQDMLLALEKLRAFEARYKNTENQVKIAEENARVRKVLSSQPSLVAAMSRLELLEAQYLGIEAKRELAAVTIEREKAYYYLLYLSGSPDVTQGQALARENSPPSARMPLAMWVYYPDRLMDQGKLPELLAFSKAKGITRLYLCLNYPLIDNMPRYRPILAKFTTAAGHQGTMVEALLDETTFILPEKRGELGRYLQAIEAFNQQVGPSARFQAIHLDLELHQFPAWQDRQADLARMWLDTVKFVKSREPSLPLVIDLPIWLARLHIPAWQEVIRTADAVVFMAYEQKTPAQLLKAFTQEWAYAAQAQKPVWIGLNLRDFAGRGEPAFLKYMNQVRRQAPYPMTGFALFKYSDYQRLSH